MTIYEYGTENDKSMLFIATAALEPYWAFQKQAEALGKEYHVYAVSADGHDGKPGDFISIEKTVSDIVTELKRRNVTELYAAYGLFKGKERKALEQKIQQTEKTIAAKLNAIPTMLQGDGYPDAKVFIAAFKKATEIVEQYRRDLSDWERKVKSNQAPDRQSPPPEKQSVRNRLRQLQAENKQRRSHNRHSQDRER